jgi:hypothetical protein
MNMNDYDNNYTERLEGMENNQIMFDPEELNEPDNKIFILLIHHARTFYNNKLFDLAEKWMNIAQNYYLTKIFN